jgi:hypothetical protein
MNSLETQKQYKEQKVLEKKKAKAKQYKFTCIL